MAEDISVTISQDSIQKIIEARVSAEVAKCLIPHSDMFVKHIVDRALAEKDPSSYGRQTKFEAAIAEAIRSEALKVIQRWIEDHRNTIGAAVDMALKKRKDLASQLAEGLVKGLADNIEIKIQAGLRERY